MLRRFLVGAPLVCAVFFLCSCGGRGVGYGVVLWGDAGGSPPTGGLVRVVQESPINSTYLIAVAGERKPREYPMGRIRTFKRRAEALAFATTYTANVTSWAVVMKQDPPPLPIRDTPDPDGKVVYKLKAQQLVKVVSRSANPTTIKPYTDYWYEVATEDGLRVVLRAFPEALYGCGRPDAGGAAPSEPGRDPRQDHGRHLASRLVPRHARPRHHRPVDVPRGRRAFPQPLGKADEARASPVHIRVSL